VQEEILKLAKEITGVQDPDKAISIVLEGYLEQKVAEYRQVVKDLNEKYGVGFDQFKEMLGDQLALTWEHEKDYMDWEEAVTNPGYFESILEKLKAHT